MSSGRFTLSGPARRDLAAIWARVATANGSTRADGVLERIRHACAVLAATPLTGRPRPEIGETVRSFPVAPHVLLYQPTDRGVRVLRVVHGARDMPRALQDDPSQGQG